MTATESLDPELFKRIEALKYASNLVCSGKLPIKSAVEVTSIADAYVLFMNGIPAKVAAPEEPTSRIEARQGTLFVFDGKSVEIVRSDQPICRIPLSDFREFLGDLDCPAF